MQKNYTYKKKNLNQKTKYKSWDRKAKVFQTGRPRGKVTTTGENKQNKL